MTDLTRHAPSRSTAAMVLAEDHPAVVEGRPLFRKSANEHKRHKAKILVSGFNSRKIGRLVTKGALAGMPIFTLSLTERATCPRECPMWRGCYGNRMPWTLRYEAGAETEARIEGELVALQAQHPSGFLVRLHVLGDFYSVAYVQRWADWLSRFPALHCYGYTARSCEIGDAVAKLTTRHGRRFAIRSSFGVHAGLPPALTFPRGAKLPTGIVCPVETSKTATCGTCSLCWEAPNKTILFLEH